MPSNRRRFAPIDRCLYQRFGGDGGEMVEGRFERVRLGSHPVRVAVHLIVSIPLAAIGLLLLFGAATALTEDDATAEEIGILSTALVGLAAVFLRLVWVWGREICFPGAYVETDGRTIRINDPRRLDAPVEAPLSDVIVAAVNEPRLISAGMRVPVFRPATWMTSSHPPVEECVGALLWPDGLLGVALPSGSDDVNCAIVFRSAQHLCASKPIGFGRRHHDFDVSTGVVLMRAVDLARFKSVFGELGLLRRVTTEDLELASDTKLRDEPPPPADYDSATVGRRMRALARYYYLRVTAAIAAFAGLAAMVWAISDGFNIFTVLLLVAALGLAKVAMPMRLPVVSNTVPRLSLAANPELKALVDDVCANFGVESLESIAVGLDLTAAVGPDDRHERESSFEICIGLPMLAAMNRTELRSIIAHEIGHSIDDLDNRDKVLPSVLGMARTYERFSRGNPFSGIVSGEAEKFMRRLSKLERDSEFLADRCAARAAGSTSCVSALRKIRAADDLFAIYWNDYAGPALEFGLAPPLTVGFAHFLHDAPIVESILGAVDERIESEEFDAHSSHPTIRARILAVEQYAGQFAQPVDARSALELVSDIDVLEAEILRHFAGPSRPLTRCDWPTAIAAGLTARWRRQVESYANTLAGYAWWQLPEMLGDMDALRHVLGVPDGSSPEPDRAHDPFAPRFPAMFHVANAIGGALRVALISAGFSVIGTTPGKPIEFDRTGLRVQPRELLTGLSGNEIDRDSWMAMCGEWGIAEWAMAARPAAAHGFVPAVPMATAAGYGYAPPQASVSGARV